MKLTLILVFLGMLQVSASVYSQQTKMTFSIKDRSVKEVLDQIEENTDFRFFYNENFTDLNREVTIEAHSNRVEDILDEILASSDVTYRVFDNNLIVITPKSMLQQQRVSGKVTDATTGDPLTGVYVVIEGTNSGAVTDVEGKYSVEITDPNAIITFSYVGYISENVSVAGKSIIDVSLVTDIKNLEEVVVIGYGTAKKGDFTGSIATVEMNTLDNIPVASINQKMQGLAAGVQVQNVSGQPGGGISIKIRGVGSIGASDEPLYVIDGFQYFSGQDNMLNPLTTLSPTDIESITVLKDASSTAIYGSRGANGVIIVTTKKGAKNDMLTVNVNGYYGFQMVPQKGRPDMLNGTEYAQYQFNTIKNTIERTGGVFSIDDVPVEYQNPESVGEGTDWYDEMLQVAPMQNINLSVQKGSESSRSTLSFDYLNQDGVVKYTGFERFTGRLTMDSDLGKRIKVGGLANISSYSQIRNSYESGFTDILCESLWASPLSSPYDENGDLIPYVVVPGTSQSNPWDFPNPIMVLRDAPKKYNGFEMLGNAYLELEITPDLKFRTSENITWSNLSHNYYYPTHMGKGVNSPPSESDLGYSNNSFTKTYTWLTDNTLTYVKELGQHRITAMAGFSSQKSSSRYLYIVGYDYPTDDITALGAAAKFKDGNETINEFSMLSYLGRVNYSFNNRYLLTASVRTDGSSRFGRDNRWGTFPSIALAWKISEENFLNSISWLEELKLRTSYGLAGNDNIGNYAHIATVGATNYSIAGELAAGNALTSLSNPVLTWEESKQFNIGVDFMGFSSKLSLTAEFYNNLTEGMLFDNEIPSITGFTSQKINKGEVRNRGIELTISTKNIEQSDFSWGTSMNIAFNKNEVLSLNDTGDPVYSGRSGEGSYTHKTQVGAPIGQFIGYVHQGFYTAAEIADPTVAKYSGAAEGTVKYKDVDGDLLIVANNDFEVLGDPNPDVIYGMTNTFRYKNIDLSVSLNGALGHQVMKTANQFLDNIDGIFNVSSKNLNCWKSANDQGDGVCPVMNGNTAANVKYRDNNSSWVEDADYMRISNITLGYALSQQLLSKTRLMNNFRLYFSIQNAFLFTGYSGANPEINRNGYGALSAGEDFVNYPLSRTYTFGFNIGF